MRRIVPFLAAAALCVLAAPPLVIAHEEQHPALEVVLDRITPQPKHLDVRIVDTLAPQMLVTNRTGQTLEILDGRGIPVIRIGPDFAWVNASAPAYYSEHPLSDRPNPAAAAQKPRWVLASRRPSWGWFDPRIQAGGAQMPATWHIDMRLGAKAVVVSGRFRPRPVSRGYWLSALLTPPAIAPRVQVAIIPGVVPAVTIENGGQDPVTVLGARGEPFLRIGSDGVFANAMSPTWLQSGRAPESESPIALPGDRGAARWTKISSGSRYTWLEWRARAPDHGLRRTPMIWEIPLLIGGKSIPIRGKTEWITIAPRPGDKPTLADAGRN